MVKIRSNEVTIHWSADEETGEIMDFLVTREGDSNEAPEPSQFVAHADPEGLLPMPSGRGNPFAFYVEIEASNGFSSPTVRRHVLAEFSKIEGQEWTSDIASGIFETSD